MLEVTFVWKRPLTSCCLLKGRTWDYGLWNFLKLFFLWISLHQCKISIIISSVTKAHISPFRYHYFQDPPFEILTNDEKTKNATASLLEWNLERSTKWLATLSRLNIILWPPSFSFLLDVGLCRFNWNDNEFSFSFSNHYVSILFWTIAYFLLNKFPLCVLYGVNLLFAVLWLFSSWNEKESYLLFL